MGDPFDVWFKKRNPRKCQLCFGQGKIQFHGRWIRNLSVKCTACGGTGESMSPLITDDEEVKDGKVS